MTYTVPVEAIESYREHGFAVLENVIDRATLEMLYMECGYFIGYTDAWMNHQEIESYGITHRGKRYFISNRYRQSPAMWTFLFGPLMQEITTSILGETVYLFNEQWVVKGAEQGMKFAWHQDSGYVKFIDSGTVHRPYLTCWCALDDMSHENGTISVLPHETVGSRQRIFDHHREDGTNDLIGYEGNEAGVEIEVSAGSIVVFSSTSLHRSSANTTPNRRRAYLAQYTAEPLHHSNGRLWAQAVPFVRDGEYVYDKERDFARPQSRRN